LRAYLSLTPLHVSLALLFSAFPFIGIFGHVNK
jgi:hypothetical protein